MNKSDSTVELTKALVKVQSELRGAKMDAENPFFKAKYADLASVWDACRELLASNELAVVQTTAVGENHQLIVETTLLHVSGEWITGQLPMILSKNDPQGIGSAFTYGRRYGLSAMVGVCPEDDDAESATQRKPVSKPPVKKTTKPTIAKEWLKESITKLQEKDETTWGLKNLVPYLTSIGAKGSTLSAMVESLPQNDKERFIQSIKDALTKESTVEKKGG